MQPISLEIFNKKFRFNKESLDQFYSRVAKGASTNTIHEEQLQVIFSNHYATLAGRILYGINTNKVGVTLSNCFVLPIKNDSMEAIMDCVKEAALTMKAGGGTGFAFGILRPRGELIKTSQVHSSGIVSFMGIQDASTKTIIAGGSRRGANMGTCPIWHPDVVDFINAKRDGSLSTFNLSVLVTDKFMEAVRNDEQWNFIFPDTSDPMYNSRWVYDDLGGNIEGWIKAGGTIKHYGSISARALWDTIIKSNHEYAEPGVIFIDTVNRMNTLSDYEYLLAMNPCGEQPLPPYASCNLGSINLAKMVNQFGEINYLLLETTTQAMVKALDNVLDLNWYPIQAQYDEVKNKRQIGLGITGLADMLILSGITYGSKESIELVDNVMKFITNTAFQCSAKLASVKGSYKLYNEETFLNSAFVKQALTQETIDAIKTHGLRNSRIMSIAPTGTVSILLNNVSSGIEPVFAKEYNRTIKNIDGTETVEVVKDYAQYFYEITDNELLKASIAKSFITADAITPEQHIDMQAVCQKYVDASISKTINCPESTTIEQLKDIYTYAYNKGVKGSTIYRSGCSLGSVLSVDKPKPTVITEKTLSDVENAKRHKIVWQNGNTKVKTYVNVSVDEQGVPLEIFAKLPKEAGKDQEGNFDTSLYMIRQSEWEFACRLISRLLRAGYPLQDIINDAERSTFIMHCLPSFLKRIMNDYITPDSQETIDKVTATGVGGMLCEACGKETMLNINGCPTCVSCGNSKCG